MLLRSLINRTSKLDGPKHLVPTYDGLPKHLVPTYVGLPKHLVPTYVRLHVHLYVPCSLLIVYPYSLFHASFIS